MNSFVIICEYNPFHNGHLYQINIARRDCDAVVCIMSGNFVQRGDTALLTKYARAESAVRCGADLVLELPLAYCSASAERFASGGVGIADALGLQGSLLFGSECGDIGAIELAASRLLSPEFTHELSQRVKGSGQGYARIRHELYSSMYGDDGGLLSSPNNILALEYVKALRSSSSRLVPVTIKREGAGYHETQLSDMASATAIRALVTKGRIEDARGVMPPESYEILSREHEAGGISELSRAEAVVIHALRGMDESYLSQIADISGGLEGRILNAARKAVSLEELYSLCAAKNYTSSRIRRAVLAAVNGVTKQDVLRAPSHTVLLAASKRGCELLGSVRKSASIPVITKPAHAGRLRGQAREDYEKGARADAFFALTLRTRQSAAAVWEKGPFIVGRG
ncbi:MAG: nucleotidyltransferase family protein [Eubacteriales bacterium]